MESVLEVKGYAAVPAGTGGLVKIIPRADAVRHNLEVRIGADPAEIPLNDSVVTQIMPLKYAEAREVEQIVKPMLSTGLQVAIYPRTNSIVVTDTSSNIHHVAQIIKNLDVPGAKEEVTVIPLQYASAEVLSEQIARIMEEGNGTPVPAARSRSMPATQTGRKIMPDTRTNSIIAVANPEDTEIIEALARKLDVERPRGANNVHVVYLENASAEEAAKSLTAALANLRITGTAEASQQVQVTADEGTNSLIITASAQDYEVIAEIIEKLDIVREQVLVEMMIMEISEDSLREIGIDWATLDEAVAGSVRGFAATNFGPRVDFVSGDYEGLAVGGWRADGDNVGIGAILSALEKVSGVNILSTPHITTSNHNTATILVGENRAFVNNSRITETTDFLTPTVINGNQQRIFESYRGCHQRLYRYTYYVSAAGDDGYLDERRLDRCYRRSYSRRQDHQREENPAGRRYSGGRQSVQVPARAVAEDESADVHNAARCDRPGGHGADNRDQEKRNGAGRRSIRRRGQRRRQLIDC